MRDRRDFSRRPVLAQIPMLLAVNPCWQLIKQGLIRKDRADIDRLSTKFSLRLEIGNRIHPHRSEKESCQGLLREYEGGEPDCKMSRSLDQGSHKSFYRHINGGVAL
jgi:hypothetical protein